MPSLNLFNSFKETIAEKVHNLGSDTLKICLTNTAPVATNTVLANITQITAANGYTAGGLQSTQVSSAQTSGNYKLVINNVVFSATGAFGPFRYAVLYNASATNNELIGWWDYGSSITLANQETFTVKHDLYIGTILIS